MMMEAAPSPSPPGAADHPVAVVLHRNVKLVVVTILAVVAVVDIGFCRYPLLF